MNKASQAARQSFIERPSSRTYLNEALTEKSLEHVLVRLQHTTNWLRLSRIFATVFTAVNIFVVLFIFGLGENLLADNLKFGNSFVVFVGLSVFVNLAVIVLFENLRRGGDALFEQISDELHWHVGYRKQKENGAVADDDGQLSDARLVLRAFAGAADLPLIPGKFGPAIYAGVNVVFALLFLYFRLKS
jgi:hypothetical protein